MPRLMEVLEFQDDTGEIMVKRIPEAGSCEVKWGAQLTVRESQRAVFVRDGKAVMTFMPGRHILKTANIPVLTKLVTQFGYGPRSPFRAETYFINMKLFRNMKWGTKEPIPFRDAELHLINLRAFGIYSVKVADPVLFLEHFVGMMGVFTDKELRDYFRNIASTRLADLLGNVVTSVFDMPKQYEEISTAAKGKLAGDFAACGLDLVDFFVQSISVPPEVQEAINERAKMAAVGNLDQYTKFKLARAMETAAAQPGGSTGAGMGMGAGLGMGMMIPQVIQNTMMQQAPATQAAASASGDPFERLKKLKSLLDMGAITQGEFDSKKAELLSAI